MTVRETVRAKSFRLLTDGKLRIHEVGNGKVSATIHGDTGTYRLGYHPRVRGGWFCTCPYRSAEMPVRREAAMCSHLLALIAVIDVQQLTTGELLPVFT